MKIPSVGCFFHLKWLSIGKNKLERFTKKTESEDNVEG